MASKSPSCWVVPKARRRALDRLKYDDNEEFYATAETLWLVSGPWAQHLSTFPHLSPYNQPVMETLSPHDEGFVFDLWLILYIITNNVPYEKELSSRPYEFRIFKLQLDSVLARISGRFPGEIVKFTTLLEDTFRINLKPFPGTPDPELVNRMTSLKFYYGELLDEFVQACGAITDRSHRNLAVEYFGEGACGEVLKEIWAAQVPDNPFLDIVISDEY